MVPQLRAENAQLEEKAMIRQAIIGVAVALAGMIPAVLALAQTYRP